MNRKQRRLWDSKNLQIGHEDYAQIISVICDVRLWMADRTEQQDKRTKNGKFVRQQLKCASDELATIQGRLMVTSRKDTK